MGGNELIRESWIGNPRVNSREEVSAGGCGRERKEAFEISAEMSMECRKGIDSRERWRCVPVSERCGRNEPSMRDAKCAAHDRPLHHMGSCNGMGVSCTHAGGR